MKSLRHLLSPVAHFLLRSYGLTGLSNYTYYRAATTPTKSWAPASAFSETANLMNSTLSSQENQTEGNRKVLQSPQPLLVIPSIDFSNANVVELVKIRKGFGLGEVGSASDT
jgi:hypothetical protein